MVGVCIVRFSLKIENASDRMGFNLCSGGVQFGTPFSFLSMVMYNVFPAQDSD